MNCDPERRIVELNRQFVQLFRDSKVAEAIEVAREACQLASDHLGETHPSFPVHLNNLALAYKSTGNYAAARETYQRALEAYRGSTGEESPDYAIALSNLASLHQQLAEYQDAEPLYIKAIEILREESTEYDPDYLRAIHNLGALYRDMGRLSASEELVIQSLAGRRRAVTERRLDVAESLNTLADLHQSQAHYADAENAYTEALLIYSETLGPDHPDYATVLNNLATLKVALGRYAEAEDLHNRAIQVERAVYGEDHPSYAATLVNLGQLYEKMNYLTRAGEQYSRALQIFRASFGESHPWVAACLNSMAWLEESRGRFEEAEQLYSQALSIRAKLQSENSQDYASTLNNLAGLYRLMGRYDKAESLFHRTLQIKQETVGEAHPSYAVSLSGLAELYLNMGEYDKAESLYITVEGIYRQAVGDEHPSIAETLNTLGAFYYATRDYPRAGPYLLKAIQLRRQLTGDTHSELAKYLHNLSNLYRVTGRYNEAIPLAHQAVDIYRQALGEQHPDYALSLSNLASLHLSLGDYAEAESLLNQVTAIYNVVHNAEHPNLASHLSNLAVLYAATGRPDQALNTMQEVNRIHDKLIGLAFAHGSETRRLAYLKTMQGHLEISLALTRRYFSAAPTAVGKAFRLVLKRKGLVAEASAIQRDSILSGRYPELVDRLQTLRYLRGEITRTLLDGPEAEDPDGYQRVLAALNADKEGVEAQIAAKIPEMQLNMRLESLTPGMIAEHLPNNSALVECIRVEDFDFAGSSAQGGPGWRPPRYLAFLLLSGNTGPPIMLDLGEASVIDGAVAHFRASITGEIDSPGRDPQVVEQSGLAEETGPVRFAGPAEITTPPPDFFQKGRVLTRLVLEPLTDLIKERRHLFIAVDGDLARLPFELLPQDNREYLADACEISYLGSGRDLLRLGLHHAAQPGAPVVVADPDFNLSSGNVAKNREDAPVSGSSRAWQKDRAMRFSNLLGTKIEGAQVGARLGVTPLTGKQALEASVKALPSPRILHIATHGFFLPDQAPEHLGEDRLGQLSQAGYENPLLRSGLALAGANTWLARGILPEEAEDGLLTAEDVLSLDLTGTQLVVLSACETALGEIRVGEGVFGLRRAFILAGAATLVMSLWKVPDEQTQVLMTAFYQHLVLGKSRVDALRLAQATVRKTHPHPYYWGAFICQGDPGPLPEA